MARLEAQSKLLYYPTPPCVVETIATWFHVSEKTRLVDPCCGKGEALAQFASLVDPQAETWGIELSYSRAATARKVLGTVLPASFYEMRPPGRWSNGSVSLAFNNPPYDWSTYEEVRNGQKRHVRHEVLFIEATTSKVAVGGHHIVIVPRSMLGNSAMLGLMQEDRVVRHLLGWFENVSAWRFPDEEYERFKQIVIIAANKREKYQPPKKEAMEALTVFVDETLDMPVLLDGGQQFLIPPAPVGKMAFVHTPTEPAQLLALGKACSPIGTDAYTKATYVRPIGAPFNPALALSIGHITMMIAGQETGVVRLNTDKGTILVKGMSRKVVDTETKEKVDDKGKKTGVSVDQKEKHVATLAVAHADGRLELLQNAKDVGDFVTEHAERIADAILDRNKPLYSLVPTDREWAVTGRSAVGLPPLPGREKRGLFDVQRHFAIAAARVALKKQHCFLNAEMGFGKTSTSIATLEIMDKWPALVMCPDHMPFKWQRDLEVASDPKQKITARVISRPILSSMPAWPAYKAAILEANGKILDMYRYQMPPDGPGDTGNRRTILIGFSAENMLAVDRALKKLPSPTLEYTKAGIRVTYKDTDEYTMFDFYADYTAGRLGRKAAAIIAFDPAKYDAGTDAEPAVAMHSRKIYDEDTNTWSIKRVATCPTCGEIITTGDRFCVKCESPLFNFNRWRRVGLSRLVQRKFRHFFKVYIGDEIHKCMNGRSDIGAADQRFISSIRYSIALTGTLFGGTAGSLFYLLYRRVPEMRKLYNFEEKIRFIDHYGVWEKSWTQDKPYYEGETGASTGMKRWNYRQKELPGVAPAVIRFLLPITLFGNITDLGYDLPPLHEDVVELPMTDKQQAEYDYIQGGLLDKAVKIAMDGDPGALSVWFSAARFRATSSFRDEVLQYESKKGKGDLDVAMPAVITSDKPWLPKEERLAQIVRDNMRFKRKTLVFVEQTGTRDIRDRLKYVIETLAPGGSMTLVQVPSVGILSANDMSPSKREAWIKKAAPKMDAMLVNPKLVETGLDLVMFSDLVFYEVTTSLYTLWQAMRRVWRLGQKSSVVVTFLAYADSMESIILARMGKKMKFAQLLYGKEAAGILVPTDAEDIQREILANALEGKAFRNAGEAVEKLTIFSNGTEREIMVTEAPTGSPIATSPTVTTIELPAVDLPADETVQLTLFMGFTPVAPVQKKKR